MKSSTTGIPNQATLLTVADLHRSAGLYQALEEAITQHQPDLLVLTGDFLHAGEDEPGRLPVVECAEKLGRLPVADILFVRGNHEDEAWMIFAEAWKSAGRPLHALHGEAFARGPLTLLGFPCSMGDETAFIGERPPLPYDSEEWLPDILRQTGRAGRTLWLMHEPPTGTPLTQSGSPVEGNPDWINAIDRFSPWLTISGHDHLTPLRSRVWHHRLGQTTCVNVGQTDHGPLHYCLIQAEFKSASPDLPVLMRVTAYPWQETLELPSGKVLDAAKPKAPARRKSQ